MIVKILKYLLVVLFMYHVV